MKNIEVHNKILINKISINVLFLLEFLNLHHNFLLLAVRLQKNFNNIFSQLFSYDSFADRNHITTHLKITVYPTSAATLAL